jgi:1,4-alpha-glucan branching enzyme
MLSTERTLIMNDGAKGKGEGNAGGKAPANASTGQPRPANRTQASRQSRDSSKKNAEKTEHPAKETGAPSAMDDTTARLGQQREKDKAKSRGGHAAVGDDAKRPEAKASAAAFEPVSREQPGDRTSSPAKAPPIAARPAAQRSSPPAEAKASPPASADRAPGPPSAEAAKAPEPAAPLPPLAVDADIHAIIAADHRDPCAVLGMHTLTAEGDLVVRAFLPEAREAAVIDAADGRVTVNLEKIHDAGFFAGAISGRKGPFPYRLRINTDAGQAEVDDAYRFPPILSEVDTKLLAEGAHLRSYRKLGAHPQTIDGVPGVAFAVWAPNAHRVSVIGDFNGWDGRRHGMRLRHECGVWELFVPHARAGQFYKYEVKSAPGGMPSARTDPYAFQAERWPGSASIVSDPAVYRWSDQAWMQARKQRDALHAPLAIFEVHLGSWRRKPEEGARCLTYSELAEELPTYVKELGFTHVEFLPVSEFNFEGSLGFHPIALYAPTGRFGTPDDFRRLVDRCHQEGIGVILNWVPVQFPDDPQAPVQFDGTCLYEHPDPRQQRHPQWDTLLYDYGRPGVRNYLLSNALFWMDFYHIDGLRVDGLAPILYLDHARGPGQWSRNRFGGHENLEAIDFLRRLNEVVYAEEPGSFTIAEESTGWPMVSRPTFIGGLGFGFKRNAVWFHETLRYMARVPIHKRYYHDELTHGPAYAFQENHVLALSHDLVVGGKGPILGRMPGNRWDKFANLRLYYGLLYTQPGKKLIFMGNEFAQDREWNHESSLDWHLLDDPLHKGVQMLVGDLNRLYEAIPALHEGDCEESGFAWIDSNDSDQCVISYLRTAVAGEGTAVVVCNFTPVTRRNYKIGVPAEGFYAERLNTDAARYGGSNAGNAGGVWANPEPLHGRPCSISLVLPPFAALILERTEALPSHEKPEKPEKPSSG